MQGSLFSAHQLSNTAPVSTHLLSYTSPVSTYQPPSSSMENAYGYLASSLLPSSLAPSLVASLASQYLLTKQLASTY